MLWSRKPTPVHERTRAVGLDVSASRIRGVSVGGGKFRPLVLDEPAEELALFVSGERRTAEVGRPGYALSRRLPHVVCSNFLPSLARPQEWRAGRHVLSAEAALGMALEKIHGPVAAESEAAALVLPVYLAPDQIVRAVITATRAKLPLKGTATAPLAVVVSRAAALLNAKPAASAPTKDGIVPIRPSSVGPGSVVVVDADEHALSATLILYNREGAKLVTSAAWPRLGVRVWKDKLLDAIADRCIRLCRRDPRDSAEAEQALFEQLDEALDRARAGQRVSLTVRTAHWFQDIVHPAEEFDNYTSALAHSAAEAVRELVAGSNLAVPPRTVWLTHDAGRLPGLAKAVHLNTPEGTAVEVLAPPAVALAAAALVPRWLSGELPRTHLDTAIPFERVSVPRGADARPNTAQGSK
jgi:hypothetical protein